MSDAPAALWLHEPLDYWARVQPGGELMVFEGGVTTYREAATLVDRMAAALARELAPGDRFAILSKNSLEMLALYYAASKAGVVPVPLNFRLTEPELAYIVADSGAQLLLAQHQYTPTIDALAPECPALRGTVAIDGDAPSGWAALADWLGDSLGDDEVRSRRHDEAMQIYTSGTTGRPKGAVLTQVGLSNMLHQWRICYPFGQGERLLLSAPMYHVGGTYFSYFAISHGGSVYLYADFDAETVVRDLDEQRITFAFLVPAMIQSCLAVSGVEQRRFDDFRLLAYGASPISEPTLRSALTTFHCKFVQAFGMTECPNVTYLTDEDHRRALAGEPHLLESTGRAGPGSEIKIVGESGEELPPGEIGEILSRGPQIMRGYWNLPEATAEALAGGWMHTGDAGLVDDEGYLYVKDRIKDMIVSGAENVYPREVESVLITHPAVVDVAVIGIPSEQWGETVKAFVVLVEPGAATEAELVEYCRGKLAGYKRPRTIDVIDELPRNPSGKVLKRGLRAPYWEGRTRGVS
jgi:acyl-CoA synthetase (AMP-forming)/AMP-acid ligase II